MEPELLCVKSEVRHARWSELRTYSHTNQDDYLSVDMTHGRQQGHERGSEAM